MIAFRSDLEREFNVFDRPGHEEVARLNEATIRTIENIDGPSDLIADAMSAQVGQYCGDLPRTVPELQRFVVEIFRTAIGPTAVSAMIQHFVARDEWQLVTDTVRRMLILVTTQSNPALACQALAVAMGFHIGEGRSLEEIAKPFGITKQALSKRAIRYCEELGLPPSPLMRSEASRESYRTKQKQRHAAARAAGIGKQSVETLKAQLRAAREHQTGARLRAACA